MVDLSGLSDDITDLQPETKTSHQLTETMNYQIKRTRNEPCRKNSNGVNDNMLSDIVL
jgi:hypothetical protein